MTFSEETMTPGQSVALLDTALSSPCPLTFLDSVVMAFKTMGRQRDAVATAWVGCLYAEGEIEVLMMLRATWARGEDASPREAASFAARFHRMVDDEALQQDRSRQ